jgi:hypothetical protein
MVALESILQDILIRKYGGKPEILDLSIDIPAGMTVTSVYTVPTGYVWLKVDTRLGPIANRVITLSLIMDQQVYMDEVGLGQALGQESFRCIGVGSVVYNQYTAKIKNTDIITRTYDMLVRAFLLPITNLPDFLADLQATRTTLTDETIEKLADKIAEKLQPIKTIVPKI